jgi:16S rRNA (cytosine1402-N4)-methyltransferase
MNTEHVPVLLKEAAAYLNCQADGIYVDATAGSGGHAFKILNDHPDIKQLIAIDWDSDAINRVRHRLSQFSEKVFIVQDNFASLRSIAGKLNIEKINGVLLDLGVSSQQLENPERGFSFKHKGPLDMRMSTALSTTAYDIVNTSSAAELKDIFHTYGEERWASRIARTIIARRTQEPIADTTTLSNLITSSIPPRFRSRSIHPATRTFQALRIAVNHELDSLRQVIADGIDLLAAGGRICIISFHSLEDRMVKLEFNARARSRGHDDEIRSGTAAETPVIRIITKKPVIAQTEELHHNPRARSAKLRVAEKL